MRTELLCQDLVPPPNLMLDLPPVDPNVSTRERLAQHRTDPACSGCHALMDPIGFGLENFDGIGAFRTADGQFAIDPSGELPDGTTFSGYSDMAVMLAGDERFVPCLTKQLATYATGRGMANKDRPYLDAITEAAVEQGGDLKSLIREIAVSEPFRMRRGEPEGGDK